MEAGRKPAARRPVIWAFVLVTFVSCTFFALWGTGDQVEGDAVPMLRWILMLPITLVAALAGLRWRPAVIAQLIFLATVGITWILNPDPYESSLIWVRTFAAFGVARGAVLLTDRQRALLIDYLIFTAAIMVCLSTVLGLMRVSTAFHGGDLAMDGDHVRIRGVFFHPGVLGYGAAIVFAYGFVRLTAAGTPFMMRLIWIGAMACALYDLVQSDSRAGQVATLLSIGVMIALNRLRKKALSLTAQM